MLAEHRVLSWILILTLRRAYIGQSYWAIEQKESDPVTPTHLKSLHSYLNY